MGLHLLLLYKNPAMMEAALILIKGPCIDFLCLKGQQSTLFVPLRK